jgi:hypothetical protein
MTSAPNIPVGPLLVSKKKTGFPSNSPLRPILLSKPATITLPGDPLSKGVGSTFKDTFPGSNGMGVKSWAIAEWQAPRKKIKNNIGKSERIEFKDILVILSPFFLNFVLKLKTTYEKNRLRR